MNNYQHQLTIAKKLAKDAGSIMLHYFESAAASPTIKSDKTIVTKADTDINRLVIEVLSKETPDYSIWGEEESNIIQGASFTWVCDPVDGTAPFAKGLPISTFSLGLVDSNGDSVLGVIYDPFQDRMYEAVRGGGAYLNGQKISVSDKSDMDGAYIDLELWVDKSTGISFADPKDKFNAAGVQSTAQCAAVIMGSLVARGTFEAMVFSNGKPEDIAALAVIVTEAGGTVTDLFGNPQRYDTNIVGAVVSNGKLHQPICDILKTINYTSMYLK